MVKSKTETRKDLANFQTAEDIMPSDLYCFVDPK